MSDLIHPSAIVWPLPQRIPFPHEQAVRCAECGKTAVRTIEKRVQAKNLYFCCEDHRLAHRRAVLAGEAPALSKLPKQSYDDRYDSNWGDLGLKPRRELEDIPDPTPYDRVYGSIPTGGDLRE